MTARNYALDANGVDADTVYTTCPVCGIVSPAASLEYTLLPGGDLDPAFPFRTGCTPGQHHYEATLDEILARDTDVTCIAGPGWNRPQACGHRFAIPAAADEICCPQCGVHQPGPAAADPARAALVARSAAQFAAYARNILNLVGRHDTNRRRV